MIKDTSLMCAIAEEREYREDLYPPAIQGPDTEALYMTGTLDLGRGLYDLEAVSNTVTVQFISVLYSSPVTVTMKRRQQVCEQFKWTPRKGASWRKSIENVQIFPPAGFIWLLYYCSRSTFCLQFEPLREQLCLFVLYQSRGERDWLLTLSVLLPHMLVCSLPVKRRKRLALDFICASATHAGLVLYQ